MSEDMNLDKFVKKLNIRLISVRYDGTIYVYGNGPAILKNVSGPMEVEQDETYEDMYTITVHDDKYRFVGTVSQEEYMNYIKKEKVA